MAREKLGSRLGFLMLSAGCAIGLGNVWRFPWMVGRYGGAAFVLLYLLFLIILGIPVMACEFTVGRGSQVSSAKSFRVLEPEGSKWHVYGYFSMLGNYLLMWFYTNVAGWFLIYFVKMASGEFVGMSGDQIGGTFGAMVGSPGLLLTGMAVVVIGCILICSIGLQAGVERITKIMMLGLLALMIVLSVRSFTLPGGGAGLAFYLKPDFAALMQDGLGAAVFGAMGQAFFTLSIGIGSMAIFGSYLSKERSLFGEAVTVSALDTLVAICAGLIIFPACFAYGVEPDSGPGLVFITLPNVFNAMAGGRFWGSLFFVFMSFAALSTVIATFENIVAYAMDLWGWTRKRSAFVNCFVLLIGSLPCVLGFNLWSGFQPLGEGTNFMDLYDFIISQNLLPLGSLIYILFCMTKFGWGWDNFIKEADAGEGMKFPHWARGYLTYVLPIIVLVIFVQGYFSFFG